MVFWERKAMHLLLLAVTRGHSSCLGLQHRAHSALSSLISINQHRSWKTAQKCSSHLFIMTELSFLVLERRAELKRSSVY